MTATAADIAADIARLTAERDELWKRHATSTAQTGLVLIKRIVRINRKLERLQAS